MAKWQAIESAISSKVGPRTRPCARSRQRQPCYALAALLGAVAGGCTAVHEAPPQDASVEQPQTDESLPATYDLGGDVQAFSRGEHPTGAGLPPTYRTSFDDLVGWSVTGSIGIENWPIETYTDPQTGEVVTLGGRVAAVRHNGIAQSIAMLGTPVRDAVVTAYFYEASGQAGDVRLFARRTDPAGGAMSFNVGSQTNAPPGTHWAWSEGNPGPVANDYRNFILRPQLITAPYTMPDGTPAASRSTVLATELPRQPGRWHQLKIFVTPHGTYAHIDGHALVRGVPNQSEDVNKPGVVPLNTHLREGHMVGFGTFHGSGLATITYFDELSITPLPSPGNMEDIARANLAAYLRAYNEISAPDQLDLVRACRANGALDSYVHRGRGLMRSYLVDAAAHAVRFRLEGRVDDLDRARAVIDMVLDDFPNWRFDPARPDTTSSVVAYSLGRAALLVWDQLSEAERARVRAVIIGEAEAVAAAPNGQGGFSGTNSEFIGNSAGEENGWQLGGIPTLLALFRHDHQIPTWRGRTAFYSYHTVTNSASPAFLGMRTQTVWDAASVALANQSVPDHASLPPHDDANLFDNHYFHPHPGYGLNASGPSATYNFLARNHALEVGGAPLSLTSPLQRDVILRMLGYIDHETFRFRGERIWRVRRECQVRNTCGTSLPFDPNEQHVFRAAGLDDWGGDGLQMAVPLVLQRNFGVTSYTDPATGRTYGNMLAHYVSFAHYTGAMELSVPTSPGVRFTTCTDMDRGTFGSIAYNWESRNLPVFGTGYFITYDELMRIPRLNAIEESYVYVDTNVGDGSAPTSNQETLVVRAWAGEPLFTADSHVDGQGNTTRAARIVAAVSSNAEAYTRLLRVMPGRRYTVRYLVRTNGLQPDSGTPIFGTLVASEYGSAARDTDAVNQNRLAFNEQHAINTQGTTPWTERTFTFQTRADTAYVRLRMILAGMGTGRGEVSFARLRIEPAP